MIKIEDIKITRLSKRKVQFDYEVPVFMMDKESRLTKGEVIKISIRYIKEDVAKHYYANSKSVDYAVQCLAFRNKVGKILTGGSSYWVEGISPRVIENIKIEDITYNKVVDAYIVKDMKYLSIVRDKKLEEILNS